MFEGQTTTNVPRAKQSQMFQGQTTTNVPRANTTYSKDKKKVTMRKAITLKNLPHGTQQILT